MRIVAAEAPSSELSQLWANAMYGLLHHRGGSELLASVWGGTAPDLLLHELIKERSIWLAEIDGSLTGFVVYRDRVIEGVFVSRQDRRKGVARQLVSHLMSLENPPLDAHVLPGDRGMKSLFESFGWKARLLTMRGE
jgi:GNAT superfamily N-acetyltransferase